MTRDMMKGDTEKEVQTEITETVTSENATETITATPAAAIHDPT